MSINPLPSYKANQHSHPHILPSSHSKRTFILNNNPIKRITHIPPNIIIPILIQTQRATRMLQEQVQEAAFHVFDLRERGHDVLGYEVGAAG